MKNENFSILDAFIALGDINEEKKSSIRSNKLEEGNTYSLHDNKQMADAHDFREADKKDVTLEVIDTDADTLEHLKDPSDYIGEVILQCNVCKATKFVKLDSLVKADSNLENQIDIYNLDEECPHCHSNGKGYILIGQVGKATEETTQEAEENKQEKDEAEEASKEQSTEENNSEETASFNNDESNADEAKVDNDESEPEQFDWNDESAEKKEKSEEDEEESTEENEDESKNESLEEEEEISWDETDSHEDEDEEKKVIKASSLLDDKEDIKAALRAKLKNKKKTIKESYEADDKVGVIDLTKGEHEVIKEAVSKQSIPTKVGEFVEKFLYSSDKSNITLFTDSFKKFLTMEKFLNSFEDKQVEFTGWSVEDDYITLPICKEGIYTIKDVFANFIENKNTFIIDSEDDEFDGNEYDNLQSVLDRFGDYYLDGALSIRSINFYVGKWSGELEETKSIEESLIRDIIKRNNLKESKLHTSTSVENFIAESIYEKEDLDKVYEQYVKPLNDKDLNRLFKEELGYKDDTDLFLESKGIDSREFENFIESKECSKEDKECETCPDCKKSIEECTCNKKEINEEFWKSARDRKELGTLVNILQESKMTYVVKRSLNENYRYDIYLKKNLNESAEDDYQKRKEQADSTIENKGTVKLTEEPEHVDVEIVDRPRHKETTSITTEETTDFDREVIGKIERIATDIHNSIQRNYDINVPENLIIADMVQDLQLVGGAISSEELANTPTNQVTAELYRQFEEEFDGLDTILSILSGEEVHTNRADKLMYAVNSLDSENFSPEYIEECISNPQFLQMAVNGMIPYINSREIERKNIDKLEALPNYRRVNALPYERNESIDSDKFESEINEYFRNTYEENLVYTNDKAEVIDEGYKIYGTLHSEEKSLPIQWNLKRCKEGYEITNNLSEEVLSLSEDYKLQ